MTFVRKDRSGRFRARRIQKIPLRLGWICLLLAGLAFLDPSLTCLADDIYTVVVKKQEEKDKYRGWLADWLDTRDRMRIQDLWLALHSSLPYEFYLEADDQISQSTASPTNFNAWELGFTAYATIFGLETRYDSGVDSHFWGIFDLRVFGIHDQGTHLTMQMGLRNTNSATYGGYRNALGGFKMALYLARPFGIEGLYQHYFPSSATAAGISFSGDRLQGGAFLEFQFLRFYLDYFMDSETPATFSGWILGTKIYF